MEAQILNDFKCPICAKHIIPPLYMCLQGHGLCIKCAQTHICPTCRVPVAKRRNFMLEEIAKKLNYPCVYNNCPYNGLLENYKKHVKLCKFAPFNCPICAWSGPYADIFGHVKERHSDRVFESSDGKFVFEEFQPRTIMLKVNNMMFGLVSEIRQGIFNFSMNIIKRQNNSNGTYSYNICFRNGNNSQKAIYTKQCVKVPAEPICPMIQLSAIEFAKVRDGCYRITLEFPSV